MYKYTPNKALLKKYHKALKKGYSQHHGSSYVYLLVREWMNIAYRAECAFRREWPHVQYFSKTKLTHVPIGGELFDLKFFDETHI